MSKSHPIRRSIAIALIAILCISAVQDEKPSPASVAKLKLADEHFQAGRGQQALDLLTEVIKAEPKWELPLLARGRLLLAASMFPEACADAEAAMKLLPAPSRDSLLLRAKATIGMVLKWESGRDPLVLRALTDAETALKISRAPDALLITAQAQFLLGRTKDAESTYAEVLKGATAVRETEIRMAIAAARLEVKDDPGAERDLTTLVGLLKDDPKVAELLVFRAEVRGRDLRWDAASADLDEAVKRHPALADHPRVMQLRKKLLIFELPRPLKPMAELIRSWHTEPAHDAVRGRLAREVEDRIKDNSYRFGFIGEKTIRMIRLNVMLEAEVIGHEKVMAEVESRLKRMSPAGENSLARLDAGLMRDLRAAREKWLAGPGTAQLAALKKVSDDYETVQSRGKDAWAPMLAAAEKAVAEAALMEACELRARIRLDTGDFDGAAKDYHLALLAADLAPRLGGRRSDFQILELWSLACIAGRLRDKTDDEADRAYLEARAFEHKGDPVQAFDRYVQANKPQKGLTWAVDRRLHELAAQHRDVLMRDCMFAAVRLFRNTKPPQFEEALRYLGHLDMLALRSYEHVPPSLSDPRVIAERLGGLHLQAEIRASPPDGAEEFNKISDLIERLAPFDAANHLRRGEYLERQGNQKQALFFYNAAAGGMPTDLKASDLSVRAAGQKRDDLRRKMSDKDADEAYAITTSVKQGEMTTYNLNNFHPAGMIAACTVFMRNPGNDQAALRETRAGQFLKLKMFTLAVEDYEAAIRLKPEIDLWPNLAEAYQHAGRHEQALRELARAAENEHLGRDGTRDVRYLLVRARSEVALKRFDEAEKNIAEALKGDIGVPEWKLELQALKGDILLAKGDKEAAIKHWRSLVKRVADPETTFIVEKIRAAGGSVSDSK